MADSPASTPKIDRRILRTKKALIDALSELINEKDYNDISVDEITQRANVGRATFYLHYKDKDELLLEKITALARERVDALSGLIVPPLPGTPDLPAKLFDAPPLLGVFEFIADNEKFVRIMVQGRQAQSFADRIGGIILTSIMDILTSIEQNNPGQIKISTPIELISAFFSGALLNTIRWWLFENQLRLTPREIAKDFQRMFFPGLRRVVGLGGPPFMGAPNPWNE